MATQQATQQNKEHKCGCNKELEQLKKEIAEMEIILNDPKKINNLIIDDLKDVIKKYSNVCLFSTIGLRRGTKTYKPTISHKNHI